MNIILLENIEKVGFKDEIITVKNGYGRNFLIPQGKAILATDSAVKVLEEKLRQQAKKEEKVIADANVTAETLKELDIKIKAKISSGTKLFGKITLAQFMSAIDGIEIDKSFVNIPSAKEIGKYEATIRLHRTVTVTVPFEVIAE
ncbi:MAG: 50S ribosomal protein L9 [Flavobacteriales bacterium]|nr:50S ribosomal protein L9 [Flavobacteriales bacterium]|tara:strand:- start:1848 stop:2282 length:435 start_codon:yes stop_codon:yes gene_type:complete